MTGKSHTDPSATPFALSIMQKMNDKCKEWKTAENIDYSLYGTPLESTTYKFAKCLQKRFGVIEGVTDKGYITNSYHVHVTEPIDAFTKLKFEAQFQHLSPGGAISYVEVPNMQQNLEAVLQVMKFIYDNIIYAELNTKSDYCQVCGWDGEIDIVEEGGKLIWRCPKCGNMIFPRINPSVIVAVTHGDYLLLTKYANRPGAQRTALVAGFTEFAESFEQTVHREVMEEVGLKVKDLRYYRCQPWGISGNIMMGYWCRLDGDDDTIHLDNFELADGAWVSRKELQETFVNNGIALTAEMISEFAAGRDPYSLEKNK